MRRHSTLLAWIAALGLLLHAGTAAASIWCAMTGLGTGCCCPQDPPSEDQLQAEASECCRDALKAPTVDLASLLGPTDPVAVILPWDEVPQLAAALEGWADEASPSATSPPLLALATVVIVR